VISSLGACTSSGISHLPPPRVTARSAAIEHTTCPPAPAPSDSTRLKSGQDGAAVLARVGSHEITAEDLARELFKSSAPVTPGMTQRQLAFAALNRLVVREIIGQEAQRLGLTVPENYLAAERRRALEDLKVQAMTSYGAGTTPERFVELELKQTLVAYLKVRDAEAAERWLLSRVIRFHGLQSDRVELQLIAVDDEKTAREVAAKLDEGADFAQLAVAHSRHPSAQAGGRLPPLPRESLNPAVADRAFMLAPGARTSILSVEDGLGRRQFELVKLIRRIPGRKVTWPEVATEIEEGLAKEPLGRDEFIAWNLRLERLYTVWVDETL
jgi:hypothetical protein